MTITGHWLLPERAYDSYAHFLEAAGGSAVERARELRPERVLEELGESGLRGRGGAGFPTAVKWNALYRHSCETRYAVMNAAEGEPGSFKDRYLLRKNPYASLEGLLIGALVIGAKEAIVGIKASFERELHVLRRAIDEMTSAGHLPVPLRVVEGPEEYLFGEEKALLNVIDGAEPLPRPSEQPPYEWGLNATQTSPNPALVNNVETYAHAATIVRHGASSFRQLGSHDTPGTIIVTLCGDVQRPGVYEVEAGTPVSAILAEQGQGPRTGRRFKALLSGVANAVLLPQAFDTPADFGSLSLAGSGLGSASFILIDDSRSVPQVARELARFLYVESCNQCSACKAGLGLAWSAIDELFDARTATDDDWERALVGARSAPQGNRCYLPVQGSLLLPSLLKDFHGEFLEQLADPTRTVPEWPIPKIVEYDEESHIFTYDDAQRRKGPDWIYAEPAPPPRRVATEPGSPPLRPARPAAEPEGPVTVRLSSDLARRMAQLAQRANRPLDRQVEAALLDWLHHHGLL